MVKVMMLYHQCHRLGPFGPWGAEKIGKMAPGGTKVTGSGPLPGSASDIVGVSALTPPTSGSMAATGPEATRSGGGGGGTFAKFGRGLRVANENAGSRYMTSGAGSSASSSFNEASSPTAMVGLGSTGGGGGGTVRVRIRSHLAAGTTQSINELLGEVEGGGRSGAPGYPLYGSVLAMDSRDSGDDRVSSTRSPTRSRSRSRSRDRSRSRSRSRSNKHGKRTFGAGVGLSFVTDVAQGARPIPGSENVYEQLTSGASADGTQGVAEESGRTWKQRLLFGSRTKPAVPSAMMAGGPILSPQAPELPANQASFGKMDDSGVHGEDTKHVGSGMGVIDERNGLARCGSNDVPSSAQVGTPDLGTNVSRVGWKQRLERGLDNVASLSAASVGTATVEQSVVTSADPSASVVAVGPSRVRPPTSPVRKRKSIVGPFQDLEPKERLLRSWMSMENILFRSTQVTGPSKVTTPTNQGVASPRRIFGTDNADGVSLRVDGLMASFGGMFPSPLYTEGTARAAHGGWGATGTSEAAGGGHADQVHDTAEIISDDVKRSRIYGLMGKRVFMPILLAFALAFLFTVITMGKFHGTWSDIVQRGSVGVAEDSVLRAFLLYGDKLNSRVVALGGQLHLLAAATVEALGNGSRFRSDITIMDALPGVTTGPDAVSPFPVPLNELARGGGANVTSGASTGGYPGVWYAESTVGGVSLDVAGMNVVGRTSMLGFFMQTMYEAEEDISSVFVSYGAEGIFHSYPIRVLDSLAVNGYRCDTARSYMPNSMPTTLSCAPWHTSANVFTDNSNNPLGSSFVMTHPHIDVVTREEVVQLSGLVRFAVNDTAPGTVADVDQVVVGIDVNWADIRRGLVEIHADIAEKIMLEEVVTRTEEAMSGSGRNARVGSSELLSSEPISAGGVEVVERSVLLVVDRVGDVIWAHRYGDDDGAVVVSFLDVVGRSLTSMLYGSVFDRDNAFVGARGRH